MAETVNTGTDDLLGELDSGVLTLTMNRPEARNAMSGEMTAAMSEQLASAELNPEVRCIVLTGAGKGLGKACAIALAEAGANLLIVSLSLIHI